MARKITAQHVLASSPSIPGAASRISGSRRDAIKEPGFLARCLHLAVALTFLLLYVGHFRQVFTHSVNIPHRDEWQLVGPQLFSDRLELAWLLLPHNEHIILTTKLLIRLLAFFTAWDIRLHIHFNFLLFGLLLLLIVRLGAGALSKPTAAIPLAFACFALSTFGWENHNWAFQSQIHFLLIFLVLGCRFLFAESGRLRNQLTGTIFLLLSAFSFSAGLVSSGLLLLAFLAQNIVQSRGRVIFSPSLLPAGLGLLGVIGAALFVSRTTGGSPDLVLPFYPLFWRFFVNLTSLGFGYESYSVLLGLLCFSVVAFVFLRLLLAEKRLTPVSGCILGVLAALATIAMGRAGQPDPHIWSKGSRYYEIAVLLVPLSAAGAMSVFSGAFRDKVLGFLFSLAFAGHWSNWDFEIYAWLGEQKRNGHACLVSGENERCSSIWGMGLPAEHQRARKLPLSMWGT